MQHAVKELEAQVVVERSDSPWALNDSTVRDSIPRMDDTLDALPFHIRKGAKFEWSEACQEVFDRLNQDMFLAPVLPYPDPPSPYLLDSEADSEALGAVLSQVKDGEECVEAYYCAKFTGPEKNYCVTRKELLATLFGVAGSTETQLASKHLILTFRLLIVPQIKAKLFAMQMVYKLYIASSPIPLNYFTTVAQQLGTIVRPDQAALDLLQTMVLVTTCFSALYSKFEDMLRMASGHKFQLHF
ncbi:uncharacterized protein LOC125048212 [Penaeus chinensis]|uniref:uncharacterized protein LOC125048212 n=1 Tax=Penaeus chinensis TaxID=139456 RepID=UPI001FB627AC|nr:uncharacterized protein LOC125048212 [Penaeus chinensis]